MTNAIYKIIFRVIQTAKLLSYVIIFGKGLKKNKFSELFNEIFFCSNFIMEILYNLY